MSNKCKLQIIKWPDYYLTILYDFTYCKTSTYLSVEIKLGGCAIHFTAIHLKLGGCAIHLKLGGCVVSYVAFR